MIAIATKWPGTWEQDANTHRFQDLLTKTLKVMSTKHEGFYQDRVVITDEQNKRKEILYPQLLSAYQEMREALELLSRGNAVNIQRILYKHPKL